jgi:hypothetical protein
VARQKKRTTIAINGRLYDALTGALIKTEASPEPASPVKRIVPHTNGTSIDGVVAQAPKSAPPKAAKKVQKPHVHAAGPHSHRVHAQPKKSQTLHRQTVRKPKPTPKHTTLAKNQPALLAAAKTSKQIEREQRARRIAKSSAIAKFGPNPAASPAPQPVTSGATTAQPATPPPSIKEQLIARGLAEAATTDSPKTSRAQRFSRWFSRTRNNTLVASSLATLLVVGYVTYLNVPRVALRVAAGRAGFEAELPSYNPSGFTFSGPVAYSPGSITLSYKANTDDRGYQITQKQTNWDSETLLDNYVEQETNLFSTYQERGLTVYIFDGSSATWVNGGVWYTISGDSRLTSEQLLKIAASL